MNPSSIPEESGTPEDRKNLLERLKRQLDEDAKAQAEGEEISKESFRKFVETITTK